jgi:hypothetical protein
MHHTHPIARGLQEGAFADITITAAQKFWDQPVVAKQ